MDHFVVVTFLGECPFCLLFLFHFRFQFRFFPLFFRQKLGMCWGHCFAAGRGPLAGSPSVVNSLSCTYLIFELENFRYAEKKAEKKRKWKRNWNQKSRQIGHSPFLAEQSTPMVSNCLHLNLNSTRAQFDFKDGKM
jgi:hypothetical protein